MSSAAPQRSAFVTVLAWISIVIAGLSTLACAISMLMLNFVSPESLHTRFESSPRFHDLPVWTQFLLQHLGWIYASLLVFSFLTFAASIALLKRRPWARIVFIVLMLVNTLWNLASLLLRHTPDSAAPAHGLLVKALAFVFAVLYGWLTWRLCSRPAADEFRAHAEARKARGTAPPERSAQA